jgi:nitroreductase
MIENVLIHNIIEAARWAPSSHNTQPWKFGVIMTAEKLTAIKQWLNKTQLSPCKSGDVFLMLFLERKRELPFIDPYRIEILLSLGMALKNLFIACRHYKMGCEVVFCQFTLEQPRALKEIIQIDTSSYPLLLLRVFFRESNSEKLDDLYWTIFKRQTDRRKYFPVSLTFKEKDILTRVLDDEPLFNIQRSFIVWIDEKEQLKKIADLVYLSVKEHFLDYKVYKELYNWMRFSNFSSQKSGDGLNLYSLIESKVEKVLFSLIAFPPIMKMFAPIITSHMIASKFRRLTTESSALACFVLPNLKYDDEKNFHYNREILLNAGFAIEGFWLQAVNLGLHLHPINDPLQTINLREKLKKTLHLKENDCPIFLTRIGKNTGRIRQSHRRKLEDIINYF